MSAQTFTNLHSFAYASDGDNPAGGLILAGNTLYGTAEFGGTSGNGTVFAVNTDGTGFAILHSFTETLNLNVTNSDGDRPVAGLILAGNTLYGTAEFGGSGGVGTVFAVNTDGSCFTNLHSFPAYAATDYTNRDGANPHGALILAGNTLYGTTTQAGSSRNGTVFRLNTDGTGFTNLYNFTAVDPTSFTNSDGASPMGGLIFSGDTLYGTAKFGGNSGYGTVFKINTDGSGFTNLYNFTGGSDGAEPVAGLILSGNTLYGTASTGGSSGGGSVFAVNTDGSGFTNLYSFTGGNDGAEPVGGLTLFGNALYGVAASGGSAGNGTVFKVAVDSTAFASLYDFTSLVDETNCDGAAPSAGLTLSGNTLYGTAQLGGLSRSGTVFGLSLGTVSAPQLAMLLSGSTVILTWPTNAIGFTLQSATNLAPPAVWTATVPAPAVVNGQNVVTNAISGAQNFFRLSQ